MRIYHHYEKWEDYRAGFYSKASGGNKNELLEKVVEMFSCPKKTTEMMFLAVDTWTYSCEHNLTNPSLNKIAYIGQAACCLYAGIPSTITMEGWGLLDFETQKRSDKLASLAIERWESNRKQLCLKFD